MSMVDLSNPVGVDMPSIVLIHHALARVWYHQIEIDVEPTFTVSRSAN